MSSSEFEPRLVTTGRAVLVLLALVAAAAAVTIATGAAAKPLQRGATGPAVRDAQRLLKGRNVFRIGTFKGRADGRYGRLTAYAAKRMKYRIGYEPRYLNGSFGPLLRAYLVGRKQLPRTYQLRKLRRWKALRYPTTGVVALVGHCETAPPKPHVIRYVQRISAVYGRPLVCTSGRRYSYVLGTHRLSQHVLGEAADIATPTETMNLTVGQDALIAAGMERGVARTVRSPVAYSFNYGGVNILFQTYVGGNHHNHVHVGLKSWPTPYTPRGLLVSAGVSQ
jgi:hypothetical protein